MWPGKSRMYLKESPCKDLPSYNIIDGIPNDGIPIEEVVTVAVPLTVVYVILATAGLLFTVVCLAFNFIFRERRWDLSLTITKLLQGENICYPTG